MITLDLDIYYVCVGAVLVALASCWGFRRVKSVFTSRS